ncbi:MAG: hypothetical protein MUO82_08765 [Candidatus Thermoplasmatota archaeon]|nr:hypothetical protein [Candidatus Thermoplasmatota archaeon]
MSGEKFYKQERARQKKFREAEEKMNKRVKEIDDEATEFEYLNSIRPEDSTADPMNFKDGGLVSRGQGRVIKTKKTKIY